jgi:deoxyribodipyrimidine photolyase-related protein
MKEATVVYPHQLFKNSPAVSSERVIYLVEEALILTHNPIHNQKLVFHKLSLDAYQRLLEERGHEVIRLAINEYPATASIFTKLKADGIEKIHVVDTTDNYLERAIIESGIERVCYDSPLFILPKEEAVERFLKSKKFMASFYKELRKDKNILVDIDKKPIGGKWSFDEDNRNKLPRNIELPEDLKFDDTDEIKAASKWAEKVKAEKYGEVGCWLPYTHKKAEEFLKEFFRLRFQDFGTYEDAMTTEGTRLFHSAISPLLNVGLLTPQSVLSEALAYADKNDVPMNSLEGFVRQILGWREFIRASYECDGSQMRKQNFFNHTRKLPETFWNGSTLVVPVDHVIGTSLKYGYTHHINRLMIMGNFMLLNKIQPDEVYRWFMGMYVDAYDWVMVPNVYGMSQFADGGSFATKPYISGSNYIKKMSDYPKGECEDIWTSLYWKFISDNEDFFKANYRLSMMPMLLNKMANDKRDRYFDLANAYLKDRTK